MSESAPNQDLIRVSTSGRLPTTLTTIDDIVYDMTSTRGSDARIYLLKQDSKVLARLKLDGTHYETLLTLQERPQAIAVHGPALYWSTAVATEGGDSGSIYRSTLDGTDVQKIVTDIDTPLDLAFGPDGRLYWLTQHMYSNYINGFVFSAREDGSDVVQVADVSAIALGFYNGPIGLPPFFGPGVMRVWVG